MKQLIALFALAATFASEGADRLPATVVETELEMPTYPFSDPDPVPATAKTRYPYFFFDGTSATNVMRKWKAVILENAHVRVTVMPEIGGKVWGAVDKRTGKEFVYYNHAVKFRNISQRGPWCSGGIEFNFGIIGHGPWTATPVSYFVRTNADGSASCFVSETELVTRTTWQVEVNLPADAEGFLTRTVWHNGSGFPMPYYQWMNAAFSARGNPSFEYPGTAYIGHGGEAHMWPVDPDGHRLSVYEGNRFGDAKSEHVLNGDNGVYGIWWPEENIGAAHVSHVTQKYGRKVFLWALSRAGGIWEDLLTDSDGQYAELQSGRVFNQPVNASARTPFKHPVFAAGTTDAFEEEWKVVRDRDFFVRAWDEKNYAPRPLKLPADFDWEGAYGLYVRGEQRIRQKMDREGVADLTKCLEKDRYFAPALSLLASVSVRHGDYARGRAYAARALALNTYDAEANYADGLAAWANGDLHLAKERLGLAAYAPDWRAAAFVAVARIELSEGHVDLAEKMAEKALDADRRNPDARLLRVVAARKRGDAATAKRRAREILDELPLCHGARCELNRVDPTSEPLEAHVRNELPQETYLELGTWYESAGLLEEAAELFARAAERTAVGAVRLAHVQHRLGRESAAKATLEGVARGSVAFALPFRRETLPALDWAMKENDSWKFSYLKAVLLAGNCRDDEADRLLDGCGERPDDPVFYLYRASRRTDDGKLADLRRAERLGGGWRCGYELYLHFKERKNWKKTLETTRAYVGRYDANKLKIAHAAALVQNGLHREAVDYLEKVVILPSEGGDNASAIWIDACRGLAEAALAKGDRAAARKAAQRGVSYPENLGVGKPFELDFSPRKSGRNPLADWSDELRGLLRD